MNIDLDLKNSKMEGKEKIPDYLTLYKDLTSKIIDTMLPNLNLNPAYNLGKNNAQQVFSQHEVAYVVENLRGLDDQTAWSRVPSLIENLKTYNYAPIDAVRLNPIVLENLLKKVNIAVEMNFEGTSRFGDLDEIVKTVLLITAVLKKIDENTTQKVIIVNEEVSSVKELSEFDKFEDCNDEYKSLDEDFKVEERSFSQSMADFLVLCDSTKNKKKKKKRKVRSIDAALERIINEVETSMDYVKNISENMALLKVEDPPAVFIKALELKDKMEAVKLKCDEFVTKFLDDELLKRIDEAVEKADLKQSVVPDSEVVEMPQVEIVSEAASSKEAVSKAECSKETISKAGCSNETVSKAGCSNETVSKAGCSNETVSKAVYPKETVSKAGCPNETVSKAEYSKETVSKAECSKETVSKAGCSKETVTKSGSSKDNVETLAHGIETVSKAESSNSNIKSPFRLNSSITDETDGSADQTFIIEDKIQSIETTSESIKPAFKLKLGGISKIKRRDSKSSVESICSDMSTGDCDMSIVINNSLRKKINKIHTFVESDPGTNTVFCTSCNVEFTVTHLNMNEHIYTSQHLNSLVVYYFDIQSKILEANPNILEPFGFSANILWNVLWNERIFIDPSTKITFCISCRTALQYTAKSIRTHINSKAHIAEVCCMKERMRKINLHDDRISAFLRGNRIMVMPLNGDMLNCIPCNTELTNVLYDVVQHAESAKHQNTLHEYNYKVQKEIIKSNPDLFGFGKQYPLTEKHLRQDKLFVNPVADFAYCGICRKPVILNNIQHNILTHLTIAEHAVNFELSRQFRDTFDETSELGKVAAPKMRGGMPSIVETKACDKSKVVTSKPVSLKRRYDESDSISQENLPSDLWYTPLEQWIQKENDEDASKQSALTLDEIIKMKNAAFADMQMTGPKMTAKKSCIPPIASAEGNKNIKQQSSTAEKGNTNIKQQTDSAAEKKYVKQQITKLSMINRLVRSKTDVKRCNPCGINLPKDLTIIKQHVSGIQHIVKLCQFNAKLQRGMIKQFPLVFAPPAPFAMTDTLIEKDTIFIDAPRKLIFCGCCTTEIKYAKRAIKAHVYSPNHAERRSIYLAELSKMVAVKDPADKMQRSLDKRPSESSSLDIEDSLDDNEEAQSSTGFNSDEISQPSSISEISGKITCLACDIRDIPNQKCFEAHLKGKTHLDNLKLLKNPKSARAKERKLLWENMICPMYGHVPLVYTCNVCKGNATFSVINAVNHAKTTEHLNALKAFKLQLKPPSSDKENSNSSASFSKQKVTKSNNGVLSNDNQNQCMNVDNNSANNAAPFERYRMDGRLLKDGIDAALNLVHIYIYIVKTGYNSYRCVDCDYNNIVSIPMAFAHLRSCFHNPVVVEGVQYLKEANYHCIVCDSKIYGIKDVVEHISNKRHKEKLESYY